VARTRRGVHGVLARDVIESIPIAVSAVTTANWYVGESVLMREEM
jgi:hypothetical protein